MFEFFIQSVRLLHFFFFLSVFGVLGPGGVRCEPFVFIFIYLWLEMTMRFVEIGSNKAEMSIESIGISMQCNSIEPVHYVCVRIYLFCLRVLLPHWNATAMECQKWLAPKPTVIHPKKTQHNQCRKIHNLRWKRRKKYFIFLHSIQLNWLILRLPISCADQICNGCRESIIIFLS